MITKEVFVNTIERLKTLDNKLTNIDKAMRELDSDFCCFYITGIFEVTIDLLKSAMDDTEDWIGYFIYECDWLREFKIGDIDIDGEPVKIYSWSDVYDFILRSKYHETDQE